MRRPFNDIFSGQSHESRTVTSRDCKVDVVKLPNSCNQADLEPSEPHGVEHYHAEE